MKEKFLSVILCVIMIFGLNAQILAQDDGKLGDFEDAVKGKKDKDDDGEEDDDAGFLGFLFEVGIEFLVSGDDDEDDFDDTFEDEDERYNSYREQQQIHFGSFPFDTLGLVNHDYNQKVFLGRISGGYQYIDPRIEAFRLNARLQLNGRHGLNLGFVDFTERLINGTDHLQIINSSYRYLITAKNNVLIGGNIGLVIVNPDNSKHPEFGLNLAGDVQWFLFDNLSFNATLGYTPFFRYITHELPPGLWDLEFGAGIHLQNFEFYASYKSLITTYNTSASLYGPEMGIRIWF